MRFIDNSTVFTFRTLTSKKISPLLELLILSTLIVCCLFSILPAPELTIFMTLTLLVFPYLALNLFNLRKIEFKDSLIEINGIEFDPREVIESSLILQSNDELQPGSLHATIVCKKNNSTYYFRGFRNNPINLLEFKFSLAKNFEDIGVLQNEQLDVFEERFSDKKFLAYSLLSIVFIVSTFFSVMDVLFWGANEFSFSNQVYYVIPLIIGGISFWLLRKFLSAFYSPLQKPSQSLRFLALLRKNIAAYACALLVVFISMRGLYRINRSIPTSGPNEYEIVFEGHTWIPTKNGCHASGHFRVVKFDEMISLNFDCKWIEQMKRGDRFIMGLRKGYLGAYISTRPFKLKNI